MKEEIRLLQAASSEIKRLRRENELMRARLSTFDNIIILLKTEPSMKGQGMTEDLVPEIDKFIQENHKLNH